MLLLKQLLISIMLYYLTNSVAIADDKKKDGDKKQKKKKDLRDYNDADLERLYEEWEKDEEPLEPDELPEHLRPSPPIDFSKLDPSDPEKMIQMTKKGKTLMMFATVSGNPSRRESEEITGLWQTSMYNNHMDVQRYMIEDNRVIFTFKDGSQAWDAKDFLLKQDRCAEVTIEGKNYPGAGAAQPVNEDSGKPGGKKPPKSDKTDL